MDETATALNPDEPPTRTPARNTRAKGKRLVKLAKDLFASHGALVEVAPLQARWIPDPANPGRSKAVMLAGDYFGCWDLIVVYPNGPRVFVQVTTWEKATDRRKKIKDKGFPSSADDLILGYLDRERRFRVLHGPDFLTAESTIMECAEEPCASSPTTP